MKLFLVIGIVSIISQVTSGQGLVGGLLGGLLGGGGGGRPIVRPPAVSIEEVDDLDYPETTIVQLPGRNDLLSSLGLTDLLSSLGLDGILSALGLNLASNSPPQTILVKNGHERAAAEISADVSPNELSGGLSISGSSSDYQSKQLAAVGSVASSLLWMMERMLPMLSYVAPAMPFLYPIIPLMRAAIPTMRFMLSMTGMNGGQTRMVEDMFLDHLRHHQDDLNKLTQ